MPPHDEPATPDAFGEKRDYWLKYDTLADTKDKVMIERLDSDLDVLLIFAGLFSAVNTAFIILTLSSLSAPPSYRTEALPTLIVMQVGNSTLTPNDLNPPFSPTRDAIRQNCTFFASLCASILAAAGAMLAKQWLQSYQRTGQTGSRRKQAILRTEKWMGADSWRLRGVVEALPTLLLVSLALFFAALCDLLWSTSQPVAFVVVAFTATGAVFYGFTVVAAAIDVFCPYQTAVSRIIRELALESRKLFFSVSFGLTEISKKLKQNNSNINEREENCFAQNVAEFGRKTWKFLRGKILMDAAAKLGRRAWVFLRGDSLWRWIVLAMSKLSREETEDIGPERIYAHSVLWMLENATEEEDILACAENVTTLTSLSSTRIISHSPLFSMLIQRFEAALTDVSNRVEGSEQFALAFVRAIAHVAIANPTHWADVAASALDAKGFVRSASAYDHPSTDFWALCHAVSLARSTTFSKTSYSIWEIVPVCIHPDSQPSTTLACLSLMKLSRYGIPFRLINSSTSHQDSIINLLCLEVIDLAEGSQRSLEQRVRDVWLARNKEIVVEYITKTIEAHDQLISTGVDRRGLLWYHTEVLRSFVHCNDQTLATVVRGKGELTRWEERLSEDPLVQFETLHPDLTAYGTQLLLCLGALLPTNRRNWYTRLTSAEADTFVDSVANLQAGFVTDLDVVHALKVIDFVVSGHSSSMANNLTWRFNLICPILTRAFQSTSDDVLDAACNTLAAFGIVAWEECDKPKTNPELFLTPEYASAALQSLSQPTAKWSERNDQALSRWLAASIRSDATLATTLDALSITSLFVSRVSRLLEEDNPVGDWGTMWDVAYLFLKWWHLTALNLDSQKAPEMADAAIKSLVGYAQKQLLNIHHKTTNVEMFIFIADFVQRAFLLRPEAALFFRLDLICEGLIQNTKHWEVGVAEILDVDGDDRARKEAELVTLILPFSRARRAYAGPSRTWDEMLQYTNGAGWWKHGGLRRSCRGLGSMMI
ncbi:hypothetical protein FRB94_013174 [Tulasnella sp. JGI-2019a]|nr:hypothetical protein FRB93_007120 [Tulasnella sp. JGI-2019a]KAG8990695.1 hypothetical protein FRB94_013174 [Tulasnella sp. JGI-2019a]